MEVYHTWENNTIIAVVYGTWDEVFDNSEENVRQLGELYDSLVKSMTFWRKWSMIVCGSMQNSLEEVYDKWGESL